MSLISFLKYDDPLDIAFTHYRESCFIYNIGYDLMVSYLHYSMKIGITIQLGDGIGFQSNGMLQNLYFLFTSFNTVSNWDCYFLYLGENHLDFPRDQQRFIPLHHYIETFPFSFDVIIFGGFSIPSVFDSGVFSKTKIIILHCGATMIDDISKCLQQSDIPKGNNISLPKVDEIWTLPHHENNLGYLSALYHNRNVKIMPYVWDSTFIDLQLYQNNYSDLEHFHQEFLSYPLQSISIYEPNNTFCKTCLIPLATVVEHKRYGSQPIHVSRTFCAETISKNHHFNQKCRDLGITSDKDYFEFYKRQPFVSSLKSFGLNTIILSHNIHCSLNNLYFDALYLGLPLLHNSSKFSNYGYFYSDSDIHYAVDMIDYIIKNHHILFLQYIQQAKEVISEYDPQNPKNLDVYKKAITNLFA